MDVGRRIDNLTEKEFVKYRQRNQLAINGIDTLLSNLSVFDNCHTLKGRYMLIAKYLGLVQESPFSTYNFFMPTESDIVFLLRLSNHNNTNEELYNKHEQNGRPDKRFIFCFMNVQDVVDTPSNFLESEHHTIQYPTSSLFDEQGLISLLNSLKKLLVKGEFEAINLIANNNGENNQETNENKIMNKKQVIRLNENQLRQIVTESLKRVLNENNTFSIRVWLKGIQQDIDGLEIAMENGRADKLLPQFIANVRYSLEHIEDEIDAMRG